MAVQKKFVLQTEYTETELKSLLEESVEKIIENKFKLFINELNQNEKKESLRFLSRHDLKRILKISYPTISKLTRSGMLKGQIIGGSYRYKESDILNYKK